LSGILRKKIRVIAMPLGDEDEAIGKFVEDIVSPIEFNKVEVKSDGIVINAGKHSKAALIGRNRVREKELGGVLGDFFGVSKLRIA
jgi:transcription antitermination factor NusA-like protein